MAVIINGEGKVAIRASFIVCGFAYHSERSYMLPYERELMSYVIIKAAQLVFKGGLVTV